MSRIANCREVRNPGSSLNKKLGKNIASLVLINVMEGTASESIHAQQWWGVQNTHEVMLALALGRSTRRCLTSFVCHKLRSFFWGSWQGSGVNGLLARMVGNLANWWKWRQKTGGILWFDHRNQHWRSHHSHDHHHTARRRSPKTPSQCSRSRRLLWKECCRDLPTSRVNPLADAPLTLASIRPNFSLKISGFILRKWRSGFSGSLISRKFGGFASP